MGSQCLKTLPREPSANRYMYHMMNFSFGADGALKEECRAAFPNSPWLCFMAPHMQRFITTPFFMLHRCGRCPLHH